MGYVVHLHYLNILLSTRRLAPDSHGFDQVVGTLPGVSTFAHPKVTDCFITECDVLSTLSSLEDLPPDLDQFI